MTSSDLHNAFQNRLTVTAEIIEEISKLWRQYQISNRHEMQIIAERLQRDMPFLLSAIEAYNRLNPNADKSEVTLILESLQEKYGTNNFGKIFQEFSREMPEIGFGDLQVRRILNSINDDKD